MPLEPESCYQAVVTRDTRFDGIVFVGVGSTGIYCRTVCPAKTPKRSTCSFFSSAAAAERAGYRPCLRCRPELAPGHSPADAVSRMASAIATRIEDGALTEGSVESLALSLGISDRHLRRVLEREFGVTPVELAQTQRLLLAKRLLTDSRMRIADAAFAAGFSSLRRFNTLFRTRYGMRPSDLRRLGVVRYTGDSLTSELGYRPPLDWDALIRFLAFRSIPGVELVQEDTYRRTLRLGKHSGWIAVRPVGSRAAVRVEISAGLVPVVLPVLVRVRRLFDLNANPSVIAAALGPLAERHPGLRVPGAFDPFEIGMRAVLGQQISVRAATTIAGRVAARFGEPVTTPFPELNRTIPEAAAVARASSAAIAALGIPASRAQSLRALARLVDTSPSLVDPPVDPDTFRTRIQELPGFGPWTAEYMAMRLGWPDAFAHTDLGVRRALGGLPPKEILALADKWRPWRSYALIHLWKSLEEQ